jgi:uncharacterized membrane protein (DUF4010 family)
MHSFLLAIIASAGLGALIGLIRQRSEQEKNRPGNSYSGVRTFTFWSVLGSTAAFISDNYAPAMLPVAVAAVAAQFMIAAGRSTQGTRGGSTTLVAALLTMSVGALVHWQHHEEAVVISAVTAVLLGTKRRIHDWTRGFTEADVNATLKFVAISGIILPIVPNEQYGPYDAFNPYSTWLIVVLISGTSFLGYLLMRVMDPRSGLFLSSVLGGMASSTATTLALSRQSHANKAIAASCAMGIVVASIVMLPRLLILVGVVHRPLAMSLLLPCAIVGVPTLIYAAALWLKTRHEEVGSEKVLISNPLNLSSALQFAVLYALIAILVKAIEHHQALESSLLPLSFVSGLLSVDPIALSLAAELRGDSVPADLAVKAVVMAIIGNTVFKAGLALRAGTPTVKKHVSAAFALTIAAAAVVLLG